MIFIHYTWLRIKRFLLFLNFFAKVYIFSGRPQKMQNLPRRFDIGQIYSGDFAKYCGLLRIYDLYFPILTVEFFVEYTQNAILSTHLIRPYSLISAHYVCTYVHNNISHSIIKLRHLKFLCEYVRTYILVLHMQYA